MSSEVIASELSSRVYEMLRVPRRYSHHVFGIIQSGLTCAVAAAVASVPRMADGHFLDHWLQSWSLSWLMMLPVVVLAAPAIRRLVDTLTSDGGA